MYPQQFNYGNLYGGFGGYNPYASFGNYGSYSPFPMGFGYGGMLGNLGSLFGGASPYDDLFSSFQTKLDDLFKGYQEQLNTNAAAEAAPSADPAATGGTKETTTTGGTKETTTTQKTPFKFGEKFGLGALSGKGFSEGGINQLKQAGIVGNAQQANELLKSFQSANAGKDVTQQQFIDYANEYKPPVKTFTMPTTATNVSYAKNPNPAQKTPRYR